MTVEHIFQELIRRAAVRSKAEFSKSFLRRSANHMSRTRGAISVPTAVALAEALHDHPDLRAAVIAGVLR